MLMINRRLVAKRRRKSSMICSLFSSHCRGASWCACQDLGFWLIEFCESWFSWEWRLLRNLGLLVPFAVGSIVVKFLKDPVVDFWRWLVCYDLLRWILEGVRIAWTCRIASLAFHPLACRCCSYWRHLGDHRWLNWGLASDWRLNINEAGQLFWPFIMFARWLESAFRTTSTCYKASFHAQGSMFDIINALRFKLICDFVNSQAL